MKKLLAVFGVMALVVTLGAGCFGGGNEEQPQQQGGEQQEQQPAGGEGGGFFSSIRDAFNRSMSLRCEYTDEQGNASVNYIKDKMIRSESVQNGSKFYGIFRDGKMYLWQDGTTSGLIFDTTKLQGEEGGAAGAQSEDDIINTLEGVKDKCRAESVPDSYFEAPKNVDFQPFSFPMQ